MSTNQSTAVASENPSGLSTVLKWALLVFGFLYSVCCLIIIPYVDIWDAIACIGFSIAYLMYAYGVEIHPRYMKWFNARWERKVVVPPDPFAYFLTFQFSASRDRFYRERVFSYRHANYVYVIKDASCTGRYKIGRTIHPISRLGRFEVIMPFTMHIMAIYLCEDEVKLETALHHRFANKRKDGEWFELNSLEVKELLDMDHNFVTMMHY